MKSKHETWMPHAGHFICGNDCQFHINTHVNGYIISTVGEYVPDSAIREIRGRQTALIGDAEKYDYGFKEIGVGRTYETMVFKAKKSKNRCCPYEMVSGDDIDFSGFNDPGKAYLGHLRMVSKWKKMK